MTMKLAVLGTDPDILALVEAATVAGHQIVWLGDARPEDAATLQRLVPGLAVSADWESLLDHGLVDAVLVGRGTAADALRAEQLKRLVADIMPVLAVHPVGTSVLVYYELDMARHEIHGVLRHYSPLAGAPAVAKLADWVYTGNGPIGKVHQAICDRYLADCGRESVVRHLARDVESLRTVGGGIRTVNAVGPRAAEATYASLQVQMTGPGQATLRWSVAPTSEALPRAELTLIGERGTAKLHVSGGDWQLTTNIGGEEETLASPSFHPPRAAIDELAAAIAASGTEQSEAASTWQQATAAMEVVDTIELSLQKGRTIEVHPQRLTEQLAFRGTMAAIGCGLLLLGFVVLLVVGLVGGLESVMERPLVNSWPVILLALLTLFLLLQAVPWLATSKRSTSAKRGADETDPS